MASPGAVPAECSELLDYGAGSGLLPGPALLSAKSVVFAESAATCGGGAHPVPGMRLAERFPQRFDFLRGFREKPLARLLIEPQTL